MSLIGFRLAGQDYAAALEGVREVVRLGEVRELPGAVAPLAGLIDVRGEALPVLDARPASQRSNRADVLIVERAGETLGVAVDAVFGVLADVEGTDPGGLPSYVVSVLPATVRDNAAGPVLRVDLWGLVDAMSGAARA